MNDFLDNVLMSPLWFIIGLTIYYFISLLKVHIIWYIQPRCYDPKYENISIYRGYFNDLLKTVFWSKRKIFLPAFSLIFTKNNNEFVVIDNSRNSKSKTILTFLNGITLFLKPYLIFSFIWIFVCFWIEKNFFYDTTAITLGQIQQILDSIVKFPLIIFINKYKSVIFLLWGITCVLTPFLYTREKKTKSIKRTVSVTLVYLSLIANISFFGALAGERTEKHQSKLVSLKPEITKIHSKIYQETFELLLPDNIQELIEQSENEHENEFYRIKSMYAEINYDSIFPISSERTNYISFVNRSIQNYVDTTLIYRLPIKIEWSTDQLKLDKYSFQISKYLQANPTTFSSNSTANYLSKSSVWNIKTGENILSKINGVKAHRKTTFLHKQKLAKIIEHLFEFGLEEGSKLFFEGIDLSKHKTIRKVTTLFLDSKYKNGIVEKTIDFFTSIDNGKQGNIQFSEEKVTSFSQKDNIKDIARANDKMFTNKYNETLKNQTIIQYENKIRNLYENFSEGGTKLAKKFVDEKMKEIKENARSQKTISQMNKYLEQEYFSAKNLSAKGMEVYAEKFKICPYCGLPIPGIARSGCPLAVGRGSIKFPRLR